MTKSILTFMEETSNEFVGIHYSNEPNLTHLLGGFYGTGIKGRESERLNLSKDARIKNRIYFYPKPSVGLPKPEGGLGVHVYKGASNKVLDTQNDAAGLAKVKHYAAARTATGEEPSNAFESSVLDAGYEGYKINQMAVLLKSAHPVEYLGKSTGDYVAHNQSDNAPTSIVDKQPNSDGQVESELLKPHHYASLSMSDLKNKAPTATLKYGRIVCGKHDAHNVKSYFAANNQEI